MKKILALLALSVFMWLQAGPPAFLEPEDAFKPKLTQKGDKVHVQIVLGDNIYVYKDKVKLTSSKGTSLEYTLPKGDIHEGFEGPEAVFMKTFDFDATLKSPNAGKQDVQVTLAFQGCSAQGLCYQPMQESAIFNVDFSTLSTDAVEVEDLSDTDKEKARFNQNFILVLIGFFGLGVLLSFTPCVFPMIPILSSIIVSQGETITIRRSFFLSLVYVLAMASAYTIAGIITAYSGDSVQAALQTPWVLVTFAAIFVLLSLSMFGFYDLEMPKWVQSRVTKASQDAEGQGVLGVAIMGFLSALIVGPCVGAPLAGALAYIGQTGDAVLGGSALFLMGIGMGIPLLVIGLGAGRFMPKPGGWMDAIKAIFGVLMLGVAIWMLKRVVDESTTMLLISFLAIISSLYLGALDSHYTDTIGWHRFSKGVGVLLLLYGVVMFYGSFTKGTIYEPLKSMTHEGTSKGLVFTKTVNSIKTLDKVLKEAGDKIVMLDFTASWCDECKEVEEIVFKNAEVIKATKNFVLVQADISEPTTEIKALKAKLEIIGPPSVRFFRNGKEISRASRMQGFDSEKFLRKVKKL